MSAPGSPGGANGCNRRRVHNRGGLRYGCAAQPFVPPEPVVMIVNPAASWTAVIAVSVALCLAGCGRKGDLEAPGTPSQLGKQASGEMEKKAVEERRFILDPLL